MLPKSSINLLVAVLQALDRWENRLEALFEGRPYDALDAALTDTISRFPVHIQPFRCVAQHVHEVSAGRSVCA